jgi:putative membrane protein
MSLRELQHWRGVLLVAPVLVASIVLGATGQLVLYIHPRYVVFTMILAVVALVVLVAAVLARRRGDDHDLPEPTSRRSQWLGLTAFAIAGLTGALMLALPPATLSSETASQRDIVGGSSSADAAVLADADAAPTAAYAAFTVLEWSALLRQTQDPVFYDAKPVDVIGFITPDPSGAEDIFYVSRFKITCCAVDAAPSGIPVYYPNWQTEFAPDAWVEVTGTIMTNPSPDSDQALAVAPASVTTIDEPNDPYLY